MYDTQVLHDVDQEIYEEFLEAVSGCVRSVCECGLLLVLLRACDRALLLFLSAPFRHLVASYPGETATWVKIATDVVTLLGIPSRHRVILGGFFDFAWRREILISRLKRWD